MTLRLAALHRYPVKSCRGEQLGSAVVEPWGLAGDRRWMVVDDDGAVITAREVNELVLVRPVITDTGLHLTAPGVEPLDVARPDGARQVPVSIWSSSLTAADAGPTAQEWFSRLFGRTARLVWLDDATRRPTSPEFGEPDDRVSFADGYPLLVATEESLAALNDAVLAASTDPHGREPLPMTRFRPNVVLSGSTPWVEDDWRRIRIGEAIFRAVKGCARCVLTTIDPDTAEREKEPIASLARIRRFDGGTWFGVNLVPDTPGATIVVGDDVEVLDSVPPGAGPLRSSTRHAEDKAVATAP